jgi:hypothetical protein
MAVPHDGGREGTQRSYGAIRPVNTQYTSTSVGTLSSDACGPDGLALQPPCLRATTKDTSSDM